MGVDTTVDVRVRGGRTLTVSTFLCVLTVRVLESENRECVCVHTGECICMHMSMHMSALGTWCAAGVYVSCWMYTVVSGYLCAGYRLSVYMNMHYRVPVFMYTMSGACLCSGSVGVLYVCIPWCGSCPDVSVHIHNSVGRCRCLPALTSFLPRRKGFVGLTNSLAQPCSRVPAPRTHGVNPCG